MSRSLASITDNFAPLPENYILRPHTGTAPQQIQGKLLVTGLLLSA